MTPKEPEDPRHKTLRDVREALDRSTQKMRLRDLEKKGFRHVKVIKQSDIRALVLEAVDKVLALHSGADAADPEVVRQVQEELSRVMAERQEREDEIVRLREIADLSEQAVAEAQRLEAELSTVLAERDRLSGEVQALRHVVDGREERLEVILAKLASGGGTMDPAAMEKTMAQVAERFAARLSSRLGEDVPVEVGQAALEAIVKDIDRTEVQTNVANLKAKERKTEGVKDALKRLKEMKNKE